MVKMWAIAVLFLVTALCGGEDSCPEVKIVGVGDSDKLTILRGCPGSPGLPGQKGETGARGAKGDQGESGHPAYGAAKNCKDLQDLGVVLTNVYTIYPDGMKPLTVLCDMHTDGGGWIVFQRRLDGWVDFYQDWEAYKRGFGNQLGEFWLGNENIHRLTAKGKYQLRVDLQDFDNNITYAAYSGFRVEGEKDLYRLRLDTFTGGSAGDSLTQHKDMAFSTKDRDNDQGDKTNCATAYPGAWWMNACYNSHLNGRYLRKAGKGVIWHSFRGVEHSLKVTEMKFRPN